MTAGAGGGRRRRIGVFGGTFDPPHVGHLIVAQDALAALGLERVLFVPANIPPHKRDRDRSPADVRLAMVRAALEGDERFEASGMELRREGPSYSVDTLRELRERRPDVDELVFLLGTDQFGEFHTWREPETIARLARVVVLSRGGVERPRATVDIPYETLAVTRIDLSSTVIRRRVAKRQPIRYLVGDRVREIIGREGLYRMAVEA